MQFKINIYVFFTTFLIKCDDHSTDCHDYDTYRIMNPEKSTIGWKTPFNYDVK